MCDKAVDTCPFHLVLLLINIRLKLFMKKYEEIMQKYCPYRYKT